MTELSFRDFIQRATAPKREDFFSENTLCAVTYLIGILFTLFYGIQFFSYPAPAELR